MLSCICRKKEKKNAQNLLRQYILLHGSNLQTTMAALVASLIPGVAMPGSPPLAANMTNMGQRYIFAANTSNNPEPTLPDDVASYDPVYMTPTQIWGLAAKLFDVDNMENLSTHFTDVNQGAIGDCWMMAAIAALAAYGNVGNTSLIQQMFTEHPAGAFNPTSVTLNLYGQNDAEFSRSGGPPIAQTIDTKIPVTLMSGHPSPLFVHSDTTGEYWPCMMEKAVAAAVTCVRYGSSSVGYSACIAGYTAVGMSFFTPGLPVIYRFDGTQPTASALFDGWNACLATGVTVCCSWLPDPNGAVAPGGERYGFYGLVAGHAYTVFSIVNVNGVQLALFRNPWGVGDCLQWNGNSLSGEWTGDWSDCSPQWNYPENAAIKAACGFTGARSDGLFWMSFTDIAKYLRSYELFIPDMPELRAKDLRPSPFVATASPATPATPASPAAGCRNVTVTIQTSAQYAYECGWSIPGTTLSAAPGSLQNSRTYTSSACLAPGNYSFNATDSYGDGWNGTTFVIAVDGVPLFPAATFTSGRTYNVPFTVPALPGSTCAPTQVPNSNRSDPGSITGSAGQTVTVTCNTGYTGSGIATCGANGVFTLPTCTGAACTPSQVPNSNKSNAGSITGTTGQTVAVACNAGYIGGGNATCGLNGVFTVPTCTAVSEICRNVTVTIQTSAQYAYECGWSIPGTTLSAAPGTLSNSKTYTSSACLAPGNYSFNATDSYGDGWNGTTFVIAVDGVPLFPAKTFTSGSTYNVPFTVQPLAANTACKVVTVTVQTATLYANECGWSIPGTALAAQPGTLANSQTYTSMACLTPGAYVFKATDSYGDGWNGTQFTIAVNGITVVPWTSFSSGSTFDQPFTV